jgi:hypothetical protein
MKTTKTRDETLAKLVLNSSEGAGAAKRFTALVKRVIIVPKETVDARAKAWKEARDGPRCVTALAEVGRNRGRG